MSHLGDYAASAVVYGKFTTYRPSTGAAFTLGGTPALSVYKDGSTTQSTTGVTLTVDFDTVTGLNHFAIDTSADGTFYSAGSNFDVVITTGTVDSVSVVGAKVGSFTIRRATLGTNAVDATAVADNAIDLATFAADAKALFGVVAFGTAQSVTGTSIRLASAETFADDELIGATVIIRSATTGAGQSRVITDYVSSTDTATVDTWTTTPTGTITYVVIATAPASTASPIAANVTQIAGTAVTAAAGIPEVKVASIANNAITAASIASDAITDAKVASDVTIASVTGAVGSVTGAVGSVTGAVGSVTGNVGGNVVGSVGSVTGAVGSVTGLTASDVAAIKAKTDSLTFTVANQVDANIQYVNDVGVTGVGSTGNPWGPG